MAEYPRYPGIAAYAEYPRYPGIVAYAEYPRYPGIVAYAEYPRYPGIVAYDYLIPGTSQNGRVYQTSWNGPGNIGHVLSITSAICVV